MSDETKLWSALAYVTLLGALVAYLVKKDDMMVKFHAIQSALFWVVGWILVIVLGILAVPLSLSGLGAIVFMIISLIELVLVLGMIYLAVKAYQGEKVMLPVLGEQAEKMAK